MGKLSFGKTNWSGGESTYPVKVGDVDVKKAKKRAPGIRLTSLYMVCLKVLAHNISFGKFFIFHILCALDQQLSLPHHVYITTEIIFMLRTYCNNSLSKRE